MSKAFRTIVYSNVSPDNDSVLWLKIDDNSTKADTCRLLYFDGGSWLPVRSGTTDSLDSSSDMPVSSSAMYQIISTINTEITEARYNEEESLSTSDADIYKTMVNLFGLNENGKLIIEAPINSNIVVNYTDTSTKVATSVTCTASITTINNIDNNFTIDNSATRSLFKILAIPSLDGGLGSFAMPKDMQLATYIAPITLSGTSDIRMSFMDCYKLQAIDTTNWNLSMMHCASSAFNGCSSLLSIKLPSCTPQVIDNLFLNCYSLNTVNLEAMNGENLVGGPILTGVFSGCYLLRNLYLGENFFKMLSSSSNRVFDFSDCNNWVNSSVSDSLATNLYDNSGVTAKTTIKLSRNTMSALKKYLGDDTLSELIARGYTFTVK